MRVFGWLLQSLLFGSVLVAVALLAGCSLGSPKPETRVIAVPSSKPYRYIKPHPTEDKLSADTLAQISRHNTTHALVKKKEAEAAEQK